MKSNEKQNTSSDSRVTTPFCDAQSYSSCGQEAFSEYVRQITRNIAQKQASHYTILSLRRPAIAPDDAVTTSCSVRPSSIPSVTILYIGGNHMFKKFSEIAS